MKVYPALVFHRFTVNFLRGNDIAFHINPRFNEGGKQVLVRNHKLGERWGAEERDLKGPFPFALGSPFEVSAKRRDQTGLKDAMCSMLASMNHYHIHLEAYLCQRLLLPIQYGVTTHVTAQVNGIKRKILIILTMRSFVCGKNFTMIC